MSKNYTLSNADMILLKEFTAADAEYKAAMKVIQEMEALDPEYDKKVERWNLACGTRHTKATVFSMCVSASVGNV